MFNAVPALMTIAVECIEVVSTVARGRPTVLRLANFSAKFVISATNGESRSIRSCKGTTGVLGVPSSSIVGLWAGSGWDVLFMAAQDDWLRLVRDSHVPGPSLVPTVLRNRGKGYIIIYIYNIIYIFNIYIYIIIYNIYGYA